MAGVTHTRRKPAPSDKKKPAAAPEGKKQQRAAAPEQKKPAPAASEGRKQQRAVAPGKQPEPAATAGKQETARRKEADRPQGKPPAYMQAKLAVSQPGDPSEKEADKVAAQVARAAKAGKTAGQSVAAGPDKKVQRASLEPAITPDKADTLAPSPVPAARQIGRAADTRPQPGGKVQREPDGASAGNDQPADRSAAPSTEDRIQARRGSGSPLPEGVRGEMEANFGRNFGAVSIHTDAEAAALCAETGARAFTVGKDVFFAPGEYAPQTDAGRELLAHELTHVVQQDGGIARVQRLAEPEDNGQPHSDAAASAAYRELCTVDIPAPKAQHGDTYRTWAGANRLRRPAGRKLTRNTNQITNWNRDIAVDEEKVRTKLQARNITPPAAPGAKVALSINGRERIERTLPELTQLVKIPTWDRAGSPRRFQVDHKVEYQVASGDGAVDTLENYELFDPFLNQSSGGGLMVAIRQKVQRYLCTIEPYKSRANDPKASWAEAGDWLAGHAICFTEVHGGGGTRGVAVGGWSKEDIEAIKPLDQATEVPDPAKGKADEFVLASGPGGFQLARIHHESGQSAFAVPQAAATAIAGLRLGQVSLNGAEGSAAAGAAIGSVQASWNLPEAWQPTNPDISLSLKSSGEYLGYPDQVPPLNLDFRGLSPVGFDTVRVQDGKLYAQGQLHPSLNLFGAPLMVTLDGCDLSFSFTYSAGEISLPVPGVTVDDASVSLLYSTERGFGASGSVFFSVPRLGGGSLNAAVTQAGGFEASGNFDFDSSLFDRARIQVWYREGAFGGQGEIGIDQPDKIRGIRSAALTVGFEEQGFHADGTVQPQIPGVQQAGLRMAYSEADGLTVGGTLQLAEAPGIRSGSIDATLQQHDGGWKVSATGTAQPAIPGIDSQLDVSYDDGAFTAEASGAFQRGMLSGQASVGVTNRSVGEDGHPSGEAAPDAPLIVYGGGSATLQIAPWLQGTAGIRLAPDGEVTVSGEIALPSQLEIFPRKEINKQLLAVSTQIPIVPGVVAEVGGNLGATAGIGPGALDQLRIGIEYNPSHEEDTHVTGDAHLNVPADAGLRLGARAGIGLGITGASATGGIELGGSLGISGAAEAGVHIDWMPSQGLQIDAEADFHAEPKFRFDVSGYVSVKAIGVEIYDNRWELAAYELGSNLRFGVRFPVRYRQGQPFDVSLDDVEFEVPEVDPAAMVRQLGERVF